MSETMEETAPAVEPAAEEVEAESPLMKALHSERASNKELKAQLAQLAKANEESRLASLSEQERVVEEARNAGYEKAVGELRADVVRSKVTAAAAAAGFADPGDAAGFLQLAGLDGDDSIAEAVADLAKAKPYLLRRSQVVLEQGVQQKSSAASASDWVRGVLG